MSSLKLLFRRQYLFRSSEHSNKPFFYYLFPSTIIDALQEIHIKIILSQTTGD